MAGYLTICVACVPTAEMCQLYLSGIYKEGCTRHVVAVCMRHVQRGGQTVEDIGLQRAAAVTQHLPDLLQATLQLQARRRRQHHLAVPLEL